MNVKSNFYKIVQTLCFGTVIMLFLSCQSEKASPEVTIQGGVAKLTGTIIDERINKETNPLTLTLDIYSQLTASSSEFTALLGKDGRFDFVVPVETDMSFAFLSLGLEANSLLISLVSGETTRLNIRCSEEGEIYAEMANSNPLNAFDITRSGELFMKMDQFVAYDTRNLEVQQFYDKDADFYAQWMVDEVNYRIETVVSSDQNLSEQAKVYVANEFKLRWIANTVFYYSQEMVFNFEKTNPKEKWDSFAAPPEPPIAYYSFLKQLNLNDSRYLCCNEYVGLLEKILLNKTLNISPIAEKPIHEWLKEVKSTMADLVGFDKGLFYDLLVTNAYSQQFKNELKPLSAIQKENIKDYFRGNEIGKILLKKNEEIIRKSEEKLQLVVNSTPTVEKEKLMDAILSKYKGKIVLVDFWATWCGPCMNAMKESHDLKATMKNKKVAFVYITSAASPKDLWRSKLDGIGGEHYYLSQEEWKCLLESIGFTGIPTYLLYDSDGVLKQKITAYPGTDKMRIMIENLLEDIS